MIGLLSRVVSGRRSKWVVIGVWVALLVAFLPSSMSLKDVTSDQTATADSLPSDSQAAQVAAKLRDRHRFKDGASLLALAVYRRAGGLTPADQARIGRDAAAIAKVPGVGQVRPPFGPGAPPGLVSPKHDVAFIALALTADASDSRTTSIKAVRAITGKGTGGLTVRLTGTAALQSDLTTTLQSTDAALLLATAVLVLVLLIIIYRSPLIPLLPLVVVGFAYTVATGIVRIGAGALDQTIDRTAVTLLAILMFGAGTDYCLLLVARYSAELREHDDKHTAIAGAVRRAGPAIAASGCVVAGALTTLIVSDLSLDRVFGPVNAVGVLVGLAASLTLLPALLAVVGRRGFWPSARMVSRAAPVERPRLASGLHALPDFGTRMEDRHPAVRSREGIWRRVGVTALSRPRLTLLIAVGVLAVCALGVTTYTEDVNVVGQFRTDTDSTQGYALLQKGFSPGAVNPNTVLIERSGGALSPRDVRSVQDTLRGVAGVDSVTGLNVVSRDGRAGTLVATFKDDPFQPPALHRIGVIRDRLGKLGSQGLHVIVGDGTALRVDYRDAAAADQLKVAPLALLVITLMLIGLLRAIVAPLYLLATTVLSFLATLGISLVVFDKVFGEPTVDPALPLLTFVFLVALGVDYNIFLMDRVREEAREHGTREGVLRALVATGPVITSAGIVLAGTFAVLSILPLDILLELGFAVALGVMLDTFFVRTLIVPALVTVFGDASWWPSKLRPRAPAGGPLAQQPPPPGPVLPAVAGQPPPRR